MSVIPYSGRRPQSFHPDTLRTVQTLGRLARTLYDRYSSSSSSSTAPALMPGRSSRAVKGRGNRRVAPMNMGDLAVKPPSRSIPDSVPRNIPNQVVWDIVKVDAVFSVSTTSIGEVNSYFSLQQHPQASQWASLYDQWCIPQVSITYRSEMPPGSSGSSAALYTAIDFDSVGNLGSIVQIEDYATCQVDVMYPQHTFTRSVKPTVKVSTQQPGSNVNSTLAREWQDSGAAGTPWFGLRAILGLASVGYNVLATTTIWYAFRNQI